MQYQFQKKSLLAIVMIAAALTGCGGGGSSSTNSGGSAPSGQIQGVATPSTVSVVTAQNAQ